MIWHDCAVSQTANYVEVVLLLHPTILQPERIKHLLDNIELGTGKASIAEKTEGMKYILAVSVTTPSPDTPAHIIMCLTSYIANLQSMARGRDVSEFYPDVVRNVIVSILARLLRLRRKAGLRNDAELTPVSPAAQRCGVEKACVQLPGRVCRRESHLQGDGSSHYQ